MKLSNNRKIDNLYEIVESVTVKCKNDKRIKIKLSSKILEYDDNKNIFIPKKFQVDSYLPYINDIDEDNISSYKLLSKYLVYAGMTNDTNNLFNAIIEIYKKNKKYFNIVIKTLPAYRDSLDLKYLRNKLEVD